MSLERLRGSFAAWTAFPWLSSWPRHGFVCFPLRRLPAASMIICGCCVAVTSQILAIRPSGRRWTGAMNSSPARSVSCLPGCRSSRGASIWKPPRRCVPGVASFPARYSTRSRAWWTSRCWRWSAGQMPRASGCLISSASTPPSGWPRRARTSRWRAGTVPTSGNWPSAPTGSYGHWPRPAAPVWTTSHPTCGRPSTMAAPGRQMMPWPWQERWACTGGCGGDWRRG
jgi:hypothetical protein